MAYSELIKNFEKIRSYMRQFYVYGFKSRMDYDSKSARSYDDEKRRIESWLGEYMRFTQTDEGKTVFLAVDSRRARHNPLYRAWKTSSFTDGDITLHFLLLDSLSDPAQRKTLQELVQQVDARLEKSGQMLTFDESTIRKKVKEYVSLGIFQMEKEGRRPLYSRAPDLDLSALGDVLDFFSEQAPCGVIGSFLLDRQMPHGELFCFKHHNMAQAMDSDILAQLFDAISGHRYITVQNLGKRMQTPKTVRLVPLKIYISAQTGRQNLLAYHEKANRFNSYRLDYLSEVRQEEVCPEFERFRTSFERLEGHLWGVNCGQNLKRLEHVEFEVKVEPGEAYIVRRLEREKRCGQITKLDDSHYCFTAEVFDTNEMLPWIRTFISRITRLDFSNRTVENRLRQDLEELYRLYGLEEMEE